MTAKAYATAAAYTDANYDMPPEDLGRELVTQFGCGAVEVKALLARAANHDGDEERSEPTAVEADYRASAEKSLAYFDGLEDGKFPARYTRASRFLARATLDLLEHLQRERSLREALQARIERQEELLREAAR